PRTPTRHGTGHHPQHPHHGQGYGTGGAPPPAAGMRAAPGERALVAAGEIAGDGGSARHASSGPEFAMRSNGSKAAQRMFRRKPAPDLIRGGAPVRPQEDAPNRRI